MSTEASGAAQPQRPALARALGLRGTVIIGLSSMIGAGAFVSLGGALRVAGPLLLLSVVLALVVAFANAASTAQLSAQYPTSGGTYFFGRAQLGEWWGFLAGWGFVIGKTASCAAMALVVANHLLVVPMVLGLGKAEWAVGLLAVLVVAVATGVNLVGITRTTKLAAVLVTISVASLLLVAARLVWGVVDGQALTFVGDAVVAQPSLSGVLHGAAIMFFAFAGYARVATLGEEVRDPRRTIPRAIMLALALVAALYGLLSLVLLAVAARGPRPDAPEAGVGPLTELGTGALPGTSVDGAGGATDPGALEAAVRAWETMPFLAALASVNAGHFFVGVVIVGAAAAAFGALLALVAGISRTMLGMAREGDLPRPLADIDPKHSVPFRAQILVGLAVGLVALRGEMLHAIEFSALGVLFYYFVANLAAFTQRGEWRLYGRWLHVLGAVGCVALVASLPWAVIVTGLAVFAVGAAGRAIALR